MAVEDIARYLAYLRSATASQLLLQIDWIPLAATLIHWKSRSLLTPEADTPADPVQDELVELLP